MRQNSSFAALIFLVILGLGAVAAFGLHSASSDVAAIFVMACALVLAYIAASGIKVADQWSKAVVLRLGKFRSLEGPGLFLIIPIVDSIPYWIDTRVLTSSFKAEKTLTKDTVPVDVDVVPPRTLQSGRTLRGILSCDGEGMTAAAENHRLAGAS